MKRLVVLLVVAGIITGVTVSFAATDTNAGQRILASLSGAILNSNNNQMAVTSMNSNDIQIIANAQAAVITTAVVNWQLCDDPGVPTGATQCSGGIPAGIYACLFSNSQSITNPQLVITCNLTDGSNPPNIISQGSVTLPNGYTAGTTIVIPITKTFIPFGNDVQLVHDVQVTEAAIPTCNSQTMISSNFNGNPIASGNFIWFNSVLKLNSPVPPTGLAIFFTGQTITSSSFSLHLPDSEVIFSPNATLGTTTFDTTHNVWVTTVPAGFTDNAFLSGFAYQVPAGGLPGGINPVTWSGTMSSLGSFSVQWQWAAAVYTSFSTNYNSLGVKPLHSTTLDSYHNGDQAGTPENFKNFVTAGARGGGGSNWTGSYSSTSSVSACVGPSRTQGFWATHLQISNTTWNNIPPSQRIIGTHDMGSGTPANNDKEMMGGFWSDISKTTSGVHRSTLDQDRMILLQQLEAAMLNVQAFGTDDMGLISAGKAAFSSTDTTTIMNVEMQLDLFNQQGDNINPTTFIPGSATPQTAKSFANKPFWDVLP